MTSSSTSHPIRRPDRFFIGGEWVAPSSSAKIDVRDSGTEEIYLSVAEAQVEDINRAVDAARKAFDYGPWPAMAHQERSTYLNKLADGIVRNAPSLADIWVKESGILKAIALPACIDMGRAVRYYADLAQTYPFAERHQTRDGQNALIVREPVGVVGAIVPWNGPIGLIIYKCAPALLAGCTIVVKSSPEAPGSALVLAEICEEIGLPAGVFNVVTADREASERLVRHPGIDKISFTGSTSVGRRIASLCGERIARCTLELGGKSPAVILDDYDIGKASQSIAGYATLLTGQVCSSLTRIIVTKHRHDALVEALSAHMSSVKVGDPFDATNQMGPLAMERQRDKVEMLINKGVEQGARLATGGGRPKHLNRGYFIEPTVFGNVDNDFTIAREEIFGPVLSVIPAENEEDAIAIANDTIYGLNSSVFTNDPDRAYAVSRRLRAGTVGHNSFKTDFDIGFGGFKQSGLGREGGTEGLLPYLESKTVILDGKPLHGSKFD